MTNEIDFSAAVTHRDAGRYHEALDSAHAMLGEIQAVGCSENNVAEAYALIVQLYLLVKQESRAREMLDQCPNELNATSAYKRTQARLQLKAGDATAALLSIEEAVRLDTQNPDNRLVLANVLVGCGRSSEAIENLQLALELKPDFSEAMISLAFILMKQGELQQASGLASQALSIKPHLSNGWQLLATIKQQARDLKGAIDALKTLLELDPGHWQAMLQLSTLLRQHGDMGTALEWLLKATATQPTSVEAWFQLGMVCHKSGRLDDAIVAYRRTLQLQPDHVESLNNLGLVFRNKKNWSEAEACFQNALAVAPGRADVWFNLANSLVEQARYREAEKGFLKAIALNPGLFEAHNNLGAIYKNFGALELAVAHYAKALEYHPEYLVAHSNLLFALNYTSSVTSRSQLELAREFGRKVSSLAKPYASWNVDAKPEKLKVGLVSGDLREHPVGYFLESILQNIDADRLELVGYPTHLRDDHTSRRLRRYLTEWKPLAGMSDEAAARLIHDDGVHVLIDLAGHTLHNRLSLFAWKPAPVQATWLGYFATTGVSEIDYLIADPHSLPSSEAANFTEQIWLLPETRLCFTAPDCSIAVSESPAIANGYMTFGCFNDLAKMRDPVVNLWTKVLQSVPDSKLFLKARQINDSILRRGVIERFAACGIDESRLILEGASPRGEYLAAYQRIDISLDPFPYTGGTTTAESLWMGVPVLSLNGTNFHSRQGLALLTSAGLGNWVARDENEYVGKAVQFSSDLSELSGLRASMRNQVLRSALFDAERFSKFLEVSLHQMWEAKTSNTILNLKGEI